MQYEEALSWLHGTPRFGARPGLERMVRLMDRLGDPQAGPAMIHIAGTNGSGSVAAMTASVLSAAGYRTGLFTSPYLEDFRERMRVDGRLIPEGDLARLASRVREAVGELPVTEFELVTAIGFLWFQEQGCDVVVLEVGLGGRFDATNIIPPPRCAVITSISLDHTQVLGDTVEQIAAEKAGILKPGSRAVLSGAQPSGVEAVVADRCRALGIPLTCSDAAGYRAREDEDGVTLRWRDRTLSVPLLGRCQMYTAAAALDAVEALELSGLAIPEEAVEAGLRRVRWPGRMERLQTGPDILLDCAHNPGGLSLLAQWVAEHWRGRRVFLVMGMLADKDHRQGIRLLAELAFRFYAVPPPSPRALPADQTAAQAAEVCGRVTACAAVGEALELALAELEPRDALLVCGSIPLVGEARQILTGRLHKLTN